VCQLDLEGIVAKKADSPYEDNGGAMAEDHKIPITSKRKVGETCSRGLVRF
jgi:hypothetical protein